MRTFLRPLTVFLVLFLMIFSRAGFSDDNYAELGATTSKTVSGFVRFGSRKPVSPIEIQFGDPIAGTKLLRLQRIYSTNDRDYKVLNKDEEVFFNSETNTILLGSTVENLRVVGRMSESSANLSNSNMFIFYNRLVVDERKGTISLTVRSDAGEVGHIVRPYAEFSGIGVLWNSVGDPISKGGLEHHIHLKFKNFASLQMPLEEVYYYSDKTRSNRRLHFRENINVYLDRRTGDIVAEDTATGRSEAIGFSYALKINNSGLTDQYRFNDGFKITKPLVLDRKSGLLYVQAQPCKEILSRTAADEIIELH